jgi:hypothetical protein
MPLDAVRLSHNATSPLHLSPLDGVGSLKREVRRINSELASHIRKLDALARVLLETLLDLLPRHKIICSGVIGTLNRPACLYVVDAD